MDFFRHFVSDTAAGSGNQSFFRPADPDSPITARVYYRVTVGGRHRYSALFSNTVDSTFADGSFSRTDRALGPWTIHSLRVGVCESADMQVCVEPVEFLTLTFDGRTEKSVAPGELFSCDSFDCDVPRGGVLCFEIVFSGAEIPCHPESLLPAFVKSGENWLPSRELPFLSMLGSDRPAATRLGFWGDSITQGIGTAPDSYAHYTALIANRLGSGCAVWNLGLGYARAHDAARLGAWYQKAVNNDVVCVCFGVNDLFQCENGRHLKEDLTKIVRALKSRGIKVLLQTVPPFGYPPELAEIWRETNRFITEEMVGEADAVFDCVPILGLDAEHPHMPRFGGHPDETGCALWADALLSAIRKLI